MNKFITGRGIVIDIDETLSFTVKYWIELLIQKFGNPENLTYQEIIKKYTYTQNVPYWQTNEALEFTHKLRNNNDIQENFEVVEGALEGVTMVSKLVSIVAYSTIRPEVIRSGTSNWLKNKGFPDAQLIMKPANVSDEQASIWKAEMLTSLFPQVTGIIDDNPSILKYLPSYYKGKIFIIGNNIPDELRKFDVVECTGWMEVVREVKKWVLG